MDSAGFAAATKVSRETIDRLNLYESALRVWQPRINLVANATLSELWSRHFLDSAQLMPLIPADAESIVDLGSGAGFPGLVLAILMAEQGGSEILPLADDKSGAQTGPGHPVATPAGTPVATPSPGEGRASPASASRRPRFTLIESDQRKCAFLREVARQTGVAVEILSTRIENPETHVKVGHADVITARALAPLERLLEWAEPLFGPDTVGLFLKGQNARAEIEGAMAKWAFEASLVPSVTSAEASVVVVRRLGKRRLR